MKKYLFIYIAGILLLEIAALVKYWDSIVAYVGQSVSGIGGSLGTLAVYVIGFILLIRIILP